ncbi:ERF family protein [Sphingomonas flavescens]|uniref:ERF family protein n=1 Tax=Sphingomonas flavescens TaxID=3132797 RepID=UPI0028045EAD|nr:ERF family protein [Sphingomonas limnosediminicola]
MAAPSVYGAINAVSAELAQSGIAKTHTNAVDDYKYRSIDDVLDRLAPLLAKHRLCISPRVLEREAAERHDEADRSLFHTVLRVAFELTSVDDGSKQIVEAFGEALDPSDKATAKAMSAAYKSAMVQTFCIPFAGSEEPDKASYRANAQRHIAAPPQGWEQWVRDITDIIEVCESEQALSLVQERHREFLTALARERDDLYADLGKSFDRRRQTLAKPKRRSKTVSSQRGSKVPTGELENA